MHFPFCSIIVLNYQGEKIIQKTLDSLLQIDYPKDKYEVIIMDNGSTDKSAEILTKYQISNNKLQIKSKFQIINLPKNIGFSRGNNVGIQKAKGTYIVLLNNDCVVDKNWLKELVAVAEKDETIFAVNPKVYLGNTNKIQNAGIRIFKNGYAQDRGAAPKNNIQDYEKDTGQYDKQVEVDAVCAVASLYRKSLFDKIGLFDESFFLYYEDVEISVRAKKYGYKLIYSPKAVAYHIHSATSNELSPLFIYHAEKGRFLHMMYHFPLKTFFSELTKFSIKSVFRLGYGIKHPTRFIQQLQYIKVTIFFLFLWPFFIGKRFALNDKLKRN